MQTEYDYGGKNKPVQYDKSRKIIGHLQNEREEKQEAHDGPPGLEDKNEFILQAMPTPGSVQLKRREDEQTHDAGHHRKIGIAIFPCQSITFHEQPKKGNHSDTVQCMQDPDQIGAFLSKVYYQGHTVDL
jgi:hypothetical protein